MINQLFSLNLSMEPTSITDTLINFDVVERRLHVVYIYITVVDISSQHYLK